MQHTSSAEKERSRRRTQREGGSVLTREPLLLVAVVLAACYFGRSLLIPLALALTLSFLLAPAVARIERLRIRRVPATLLAILAASAVLGSGFWLVGTQIVNVVNALPSHSANIRAKLDKTHVPPNSPLGQALVSLEGLGQEFSSSPDAKAAQQRALEEEQSIARARTRAQRAAARRAAEADSDTDPTPVIVVQQPTSELAYLRQITRPVLAPLGTAGMVLVFAIYMLAKREDLRNRLLLLAGMGRLNVVTQALDDAADRISRFLIANVAVNLGIGVVFGLALYSIGVPEAALWGGLLALLRLVPYLGPILGGALPALFALIYFPTWWQAACTLAFLGLLETMVANFLEPWLYGAHTGISELALLTMAIVWTLLWGWPGLVLSTPLTVCLVVVARVMPQMRFLHILLGDDARLTPETRFYERMLALDQAEARAIADSFMEESTPIQLYDTMLLPALALAETERHKGVLEESRSAFFHASIAELVSEFATHAPADASESTPESETLQPAVRRACPVVCIPATDHADELAATMLAQILENSGRHKTLVLSPSALSASLLACYAAEPGTVLCISAMPPFAFAAARELYARLRAALPANPILIALWGSQLNADLLHRRFALQPGDLVVSNLAAAVGYFAERSDVDQEKYLYARP